MSRIKIISCAIVILFAAFIIKNAGTKNEEKYTATFFDTFDTVVEITGYAKSEEEFTMAAEDLRLQLVYYNSLFDIYNDYEDIANIKTINDNAGISPVAVDEEIINLVKFGKDIYSVTDGNVNIAFGSVLLIWHDYRQEAIDNPASAAVPDMSELVEANAHCDIEDIIIDEDAGTVYLADPGMSIDVGSMAKGYAVQKTLEYAKQKGYDNILINAGGNVASIGTRADGDAFVIGIQNPDTESDKSYIKKLEISDGICVVTSGDYQRYYMVDGQKYCHIINPDTLFPADRFSQTTVVYTDSGYADAISTAIFNMDLKEGMDFINGTDGMEAMWVDRDGGIYYSENFEDYIKE